MALRKGDGILLRSSVSEAARPMRRRARACVCVCVCAHLSQLCLELRLLQRVLKGAAQRADLVELCLLLLLPLPGLALLLCLFL